ncbi:type II secretion system F family protein [Mycobacterium sp. DL592]|uniref:type II secretion system F family protein n=1 Tax=Mycobacterium sp. DL592 TaxID=2675524 RepID=UPI00141FB691|nr:type II secretion system F family protein [Mycobacterium sp. DL592]
MLLAAALVAAPAPPRRRIGLPKTRLSVKLPVLAVLIGAAVLLLPPAVVLATAILAATVIARRRRSLRARQRNTDGQALAAALEILVGELRVGAHPVRAFAVAASESDGPVGGSLRAVAARAGLGADVAGGMRAVAAKSAVAEQWSRLAVCWQLAAEHGLAMSALMRAAQRDIVERQRFTARVEAGLAGARATAVILAGLPVLGVLLGQLIGAKPIAFLAGRGIGGLLLVAGVVLICLGLLWADRITERTLT